MNSQSQPFLFRGHWLVVMRVLWVAITAVYIVVNAIGMGEVVRQYNTMTGIALVVGYSKWTQQGLLEALHSAGLPVSFWTTSGLAGNVLGMLSFLVMGGLLFVRRPGDWFTWVTSLFLVTFGLISSGGILALNTAYPSHWLNNMLALPWLGFYVFFFAFPNGRFVPRWTAAWAVILAVVFFSPLAGNPAYEAIVVLAFLSAVFAQVYRYLRVSDAIQRSQARWVLYTISLVALGEIVGQGVVPAILPAVTVEGGPKLIYSLFLNGFVGPGFGLLPVSIAIAILRYKLWNIDVIIRRTVTYGLLSAMLLALYVGSVVVLQRVFVALTGQRQELAIILSTLVIYAMFVPLRNRLQSVIDRRFFRRKYDAQQVLEGFAWAVRDEVDTHQLATGLIDAVEGTLQPERIALWIQMPEKQR